MSAPGHAGPIVEDAPIAPISPYAESKAAAEALLFDAAASTGVPLVVARPFPHTGPGQDTRFVLPAFAARLRAAKQAGDRTFAVGTLDVVRDFLDVRDVVAAYLALLARVQDYAVWVALRLFIGVALTVVFILGESWINQLAVEKWRGRLVALYGTGYALSQLCGPLLLTALGTASHSGCLL